VQQFQHGQSNPTFLLELPGCPQRMVLRKQPPGQLLASAHAVDREYRVLRALEGTRVPVPRPLALCQDKAVLGTQFYVMEFAAGAWVFSVGFQGHCSSSKRLG
jgi:acyl-CoA dehydrogenase/acyl-CoA dehydrogenase family protein 10